MNTLRPRPAWPPPRPAPRSPAFSLVELLVVVAVVMILLAMLMPALQRAQETVQSAQCVSNLRQISVLVLQWAAENDGDLLPCLYYTDTTSATTWMSFLDQQGTVKPDFGKTRRTIYNCPAGENRWDPGTAQASTEFGVNFWSRANNQPVSGPPDPYQPRKLARITNAPSRIYMADAGTTPDAITYLLIASDPGNYPKIRHNGGFNALMLDMHAEHFRAQLSASSPPWCNDLE